jgi:urocanate hydratase
MVWSFRWVCASGKPEDLQKQIPSPSARRNGKTAPIEIQQQMQDNIQWIKGK